MGKKPTDATCAASSSGPKGCEITGIAETPDGRTIFVNIQHPGENTTAAQLTAGTPESVWPEGGGARPRSATVVITRNDGGRVADRVTPDQDLKRWRVRCSTRTPSTV